MKLNSKFYTPLILLLLIILGLIVHHSWLNFNHTFTHTDWELWPDIAISQSWFANTTWVNFFNLGQPNIQLNFYGFEVFWSFLNKLGSDYNFAVWLTYLMPIAVMQFASPYLLAKKLFKLQSVSILVALFYGSIVYYLAHHSSHLPMIFIFSLTPLIYLLLIKSIETKSLKFWLAFVLMLWLSSVYELRVTLLTVAILLAYIPFMGKEALKANWRQIGLVSIVFGLLSLFWVLPTALGGISQSVAAVANRGLFGNVLFDLNHALTIYDSSWTGHSSDENFILQPIITIYWLTPIIAFSSLLFFKKMSRADKLLLLYFLLISLAGILLTKQSAPPVTKLYQELYNFLPGFNLYREASKFYLLTGFGFLGLVGLSLKYFKVGDNKNTFAFAGAGIAIIATCAFGVKPFLTNEFGGMMTPRTIPYDYAQLNELISKDPDSFRTAWLPTQSRWATYDVKHPKLSIVNLFDNSWLSQLYPDDPKFQLNIGVKEANLMKEQYAESLIDSFNIKYLVVPTHDAASDDDFIKFYLNDPNYYTHTLDQLPWLQKMKIGNKLVVYKNKNFKPYFTSTTSVSQVSSLSNTAQDYMFNQQALQQHDLNFIGNSASDHINSNAPRTHITDLFESLQASNITSGKVTRNISLNAAQNSTLYSDSNRPSYDYQVKNGQVEFNRMHEGAPSINGQAASGNTKEAIAHSPISATKQYRFSIGKTLYPLDKSGQTPRSLGSTQEAIKLFSLQGPNLVKNGSFEKGTWHPFPEDCNNYDNKPITSMLTTQEFHSDGAHSLVLGSKNHTACTPSNAMPVTAGQYYTLHYDYKIKNGQRAGYDLVFNDPKHTVWSADQTSNGGQINFLNTYFQPPAGATTVQVRLKGYPDDRNKAYAQTFYDNVQVQALNKEADIAEAYTPHYQEQTVNNASALTASVSAPQSAKNLIENPSLEQGLWQKQVGDCNKYDDNPKLDMKQSSVASEGKKSLEISATRHVACTGPNTVRVKEGNTYLLSFDYQSPNNAPAGYFVSFNDAAGGSVSQQLPIKDKTWQHFSKTIQVPYGATELHLSVYSYADDYGSSPQINRYDNFGLVNIPDLADRYYLVSTPKQALQQPQQIHYDLDSPTKKRIHVQSAKTGFYLNMSESYNSGWRLELNDAQVAGIHSWLPNAVPTAVAASDHFNLNGFLNSWYVDPAKLCGQGSSACHKNADGSWDMELVAEFTPQRYFYVGLIVSGITLAGCITYLIVATIRRKQNKSKGTPPKPPIARGPATLHQRTAARQRRDIRLLGRLAHVASKRRLR